ncbi:MAG: PmoA family protein [Planctomycetes bacterium]|nr:PmoA family protein [Planctomycetota bacterium]
MPAFARSTASRIALQHAWPLAFGLALAGCRSPEAAQPTLPTSPEVRTAAGTLAATLEGMAYDPAQHDATCKVYHHVYAPDGRLLTKGLGGEFPHHRGLFVGWNQLTCGGATFDFWHCRKGESLRFQGFRSASELGMPEDHGWQVAAVSWCRGDGTALLDERRATRAVDLGDGVVALQVHCVLSALGDPVALRGDPQHSGHQFRALQDFAPAAAAKVRYLRPAGAVAQADDVWTECDWLAAVLPLATGPVTVVRVEGAGNPTPQRGSTRGYGRFGATFAATVVPGAPLRLSWVYVVANGERTAAWCAEVAGRLRG